MTLNANIYEPFIGKYCIIRCNFAGVHAGTVLQAEGNICVLQDSRRLWAWNSEATLSELAMFGVVSVTEAHFGCVLPAIALGDAYEIIPCTPQAQQSIESVPIWRAKTT